MATRQHLIRVATTAGGDSNGLAEFIAQEEMERSEGFWWSDDSRFIAFTQVDQSNVPVFRISHYGSDDPNQVMISNKNLILSNEYNYLG